MVAQIVLCDARSGVCQCLVKKFTEIFHFLKFLRNLAVELIAQGSDPVKIIVHLAVRTTQEQPIKRKKCNFSFPKDIRKQSLGDHWPKFAQQKGIYEMCSIRKIQSKLIRNLHFATYFSPVMRKRIVFRIITLSSVNKNMWVSTFFILLTRYF